jgi:hypothetical protein
VKKIFHSVLQEAVLANNAGDCFDFGWKTSYGSQKKNDLCLIVNGKIESCFFIS